ncbi:MAG: aminodeoxychorismate synthase component I [Actinobacteria bacterium]|nr:aminodeoxychorismate synthase component I [Actinomycetota bacterium]MBU4240780.1 aminodeoxychorismate synthase component I [Actinomycetota bacterium]MBU4301925.1 aminodeoxychorismate synthase component I [Actinomycetota bacterium]MBU4386317.1 aminodeoxychorismate synthase component I [Actinomycetota bacterium]MBU4489922.1 aminodeoxychorismate synthase component I [Actinomycetota bacterium]
MVKKAAAPTDTVEVGLEVVDLEDDREMADIFDEVAHLEHSCFLDSSLLMPRFGRHSFIGFDPYLVLTTRGRGARFRLGSGEEEVLDMDPFDALRQAQGARILRPGARPGGLPPFVSGGIGFLSYELGRYIERLPETVEDDLDAPEMAFCFFDSILVADHASGRKALVVSVPRGLDPAPVVRQSLERIAPGAGVGRSGGPPLAGPGATLQFESGFTRDEYLEAVSRVKEFIVAGDIYQANISQRFSAPLLEPAWHLYRRLRVLNAAPFSAYLNFGEFAVASSSPERFLAVDGRSVETRPIKGTRPRGDDPAEDERQKRELLASAKDLAELSMIVDLERNDLGRVCDYGSVVVEEHAELESYATVHHLVSTVTGKLHEGKDMIDLLRATFPGGSITGAPKIRSIEIIDELEPTARSVYTGGIGYLGADGSHDINIAIRTLMIKGGRVYFQVGGGIVADSDPEAEYQETLDKGKAITRTILAES